MYGRLLLVLLNRIRPVSMVILELLFIVLLTLRDMGKKARRYRRIG